MTAQYGFLVRVCQHRLKRVERRLRLALQDEDGRRCQHEQAQQNVFDLQHSLCSVQIDNAIGVSVELHAVRASDDYRQSLEAELGVLQSVLQERAAELASATRLREAAARAQKAAAVKLDCARAQQRKERRRAVLLDLAQTEEQALENWTVARFRVG